MGAPILRDKLINKTEVDLLNWVLEGPNFEQPVMKLTYVIGANVIRFLGHILIFYHLLLTCFSRETVLEIICLFIFRLAILTG